MGKPATDRGVHVVVDPEPVIVAGDPARLRQLVMILVDNAIRHSPADGRVGVAVRAERAGASLVVEDEGPGIRPEDMPHVFERFYRRAAAPRAAGPGSVWPSPNGSSTGTAAASTCRTGPRAGHDSWSASRPRAVLSPDGWGSASGQERPIRYGALDDERERRRQGHLSLQF